MVKAHDVIEINFPTQKTISALIATPDNINVEIIHQHEDFLILNKPAGLIVHAPHVSSTEFTLVDWLLAQHKEIANVGVHGRAGIVHRLDKDTSGIIIIARTHNAHTQFGNMFATRGAMHKTYHALVAGHPPKSGTIDIPIGRSLSNKTKMATFDPSIYTSAKTRQAVTHYTVLEYFNDCALVEAKPVTGRTHQIRVHLAAIGHPLLGDTTYGTSSIGIKRHALHAKQISFNFNNQDFSFSAIYPDDLKNIVEKLRSIQD